MTINDMHPMQLIEHRIKMERADRNKISSDIKNDTDEFSFPNTKKDSSHGMAARKNRNKRDDLAMQRLIESNNVSELEQMAKDYE
tara:strand:+ start:12401 stop:12655 length:255 start_codon:yes stop_codon:yes gene_type:complete